MPPLFILLLVAGTFGELRATQSAAASPDPFAGKIAVNAKDSVPDWPKPIEAPANAPNILLIMLDDVGFADTSTFGGIAQTPVLDGLAAQGLRYNRFHTTAVCATTRAALLSGRNHHRVGYGGFGGVGFPGYDGIWKKETVSIPEVLKRNGYSTAAFGKWHNTPYQEISPVGPFDHWPTGLGFEYFYGNLLGMSSQWEPPLWRNTELVAPPKTAHQGYHFTTDIADEAIRWLHTHRSLAPERPYFLYFAPEAAHIPHHVTKDWADRYRGRFDRGWDELRPEVFQRQRRHGVVPSDAILTPRPKDVPAWNSLSADEKRRFAREMEVYAGFLEHTDHEIGRLIHAVQEGERSDNTIILFIVGDNGAMLIPDANLADSSTQAIDAIGGLHSPLIGRHQTGWSWVSYAAGWAWMGNTPFLRAKGAASHFGGTRSALVVSWPDGITDAGGLRTRFAHVNDIAATLYDAAGIDFPETVDGVRQIPLDGVSLVPTFKAPEAAEPDRVQYFEFAGSRAIYQNGWMAATYPDMKNGFGKHDFTWDRWELYDLNRDFSQSTDLVSRYPQKLQLLQALFDSEARRNGVYPLGAGTQIRASEAVEGKRKFVFYPGFPTTYIFPGSPTAPRYTTWDFSKVRRIEADVVIDHDNGEGAILAWGSRNGGIVLYMKNNRPVYENNVGGRDREILTSEAPMRSGKAKIAVEFELLESGVPQRTIGRLYVNGRKVTERELSPNSTHFFEGAFDIGRNSISPVSSAYEPPFGFNGTLEKVTVELR